MYNMETDNKISKRERPKETTKDPNRLRIRNPNGRLIDLDRPQYKTLLKKGYKINNDKSKLELLEGLAEETKRYTKDD